MIRAIKTVGHFFRGFWVIGASVPKGTRDLNAILDALKADFDQSVIEAERKMLQTQANAEELEKLVRSTETSALFSTVGRALTAWSKMEEILVAITSLFFKANSEKTGVLMYSIQSPGSWLTAMHDLFEMDEALKIFQKRFDKISDRIGRLIDTRNRLAHHSVRMDAAQIQAPEFDARTKSRKQKPLALQEVSDFTEAILDITDDLNDLFGKMSASLEPLLEKRPE